MVEKIAENQDYNSQPLGINKIFNTTYYYNIDTTRVLKPQLSTGTIKIPFHSKR